MKALYQEFTQRLAGRNDDASIAKIRDDLANGAKKAMVDEVASYLRNPSAVAPWEQDYAQFMQVVARFNQLADTRPELLPRK